MSKRPRRPCNSVLGEDLRRTGLSCRQHFWLHEPPSTRRLAEIPGLNFLNRLQWDMPSKSAFMGRCGREFCVLGSVMLGSAFAGACGASGPPFEAEESTKDLELASAGDLPLLDEQGNFLQGHLDWLKEVFGEDDYEPPTWVQVFADDSPPECNEGALIRGCHDDAVIRTTWDSAPHLLAHTFLEGGQSRTHPVIAEGLATWASGVVMVSPATDRREVGGHFALDPDGLADADIQASLGHFMAWVEERYGAATLVELHREARAELSADELRQRLGTTLGASFDAILNDYAATSFDYYPGRGPYACGYEAKGVSLGVSWSSTLGPRGLGTLARLVSDDQAEYWLRMGFDFEVPGLFEVQLSTGGVITRCLEAPTNEEDLPQVAAPIQRDWEERRPHPRPPGIPDDYVDPVVVDLAVGRYDIWLGRPVDSDVEGAEGSVQSVDIEG